MTNKNIVVGKVRLHRRAGRAIQKHGRFALHITRRILAHSAEIAVVLAVVSVVVQLAYPRDRALPLTRVGELQVGGAQQTEISRQLQDVASTKTVTLKTPHTEWHVNPVTMGIGARTDATAALAVQYSWWERLLPFSAVVRVLQSPNTNVLMVIDKPRLQAFAERFVAEEARAAQDAAIRIDDGRVAIDPARDGYQFNAKATQRQLSTISIGSQETADLQPEWVMPQRSAQSLDEVGKQAEAILAKKLTLKVADKTYTPDRKQLGEWIGFEQDANTKATRAVLQESKIREYLERINGDIAISPGTVTVTVRDGQEVSRTQAQEGRSVAVDQTVQTIRDRLLAKEAETQLDLPVVTAPPKIVYDRTYSQATSGLQAIIQDWESGTYGTYGVVVREIGGAGRYADFQPDRPFVPSSTYKMFIAYLILLKIQQGEITTGQTTDIGWTVHDCMEEMILHSTNPCAVSFQNMLGWEYVDSALHQAGFTNTMLNNKTGGEKSTTVREEASFLLRLQAGQLLNQAHTDYLLGLFKRQVWRGGIPQGVPRGTTVANKVGFYNGWVHDVAIVYSPNGTYILAIMSKGGADPAFADLSRRVYRFFNP